jgi:N-acetylglucosamine kinase-like BadF-type ATPase
MTGVRRKKDREDLKIKLMEFINHKNVIVETDTKIAHFGAFKGKNGIVFIIGTGSILYGIINKKVYRVGGWGKLLGDYGSGYHIGQEALKEVVKEYDNRKEFSLLTKALKKEFDITHSNIIQKIYHEKFPVQNVAKIVFECAKANDSKSLKIINESAEKLCEQLNGFMKLCKWKKKLGIALTGSIIENENIFSNKLKLYIRDNFSNLEILKNVNSPAFGAALMAKKNFK